MRRGTGGFTFVEILAAMVFLGILMPVVIGALLLSNRASEVAERSGVAAQLAENRLAELQLADAWTTAGASGDFAADHPGYRWELTKTDWQAGTMTELQLSVFFLVQSREDSVRLATLVRQPDTASP